jgi:hypothetical protein
VELGVTTFMAEHHVKHGPGDYGRDGTRERVAGVRVATLNLKRATLSPGNHQRLVGVEDLRGNVVVNTGRMMGRGSKGHGEGQENEHLTRERLEGSVAPEDDGGDRNRWFSRRTWIRNRRIWERLERFRFNSSHEVGEGDEAHPPVASVQ